MLKIMAAAKFSIIIIIQVEVLISAHQLRIWYFFEINKRRLGAAGVGFRCFIICWNVHWEWKIIEYGTENTDGLIIKEYDVSEDKVLFDNTVSQPAKLES